MQPKRINQIVTWLTVVQVARASGAPCNAFGVLQTDKNECGIRLGR